MAVVEFAIVSLLLFTIVFGVVEYGYLFFIRQTVVNAAREGCRNAVLKSSTSPYGVATAKIQEMMNAAGIADDDIEIDIIDRDADDEATEYIKVTVSVDYNAITLTGFFGSHGDRMSGSCEMRKEGM